MDQLYFVVHTHWDREWYQPFQQMRARLVEMADAMIPLVEDGTLPCFHFDGQTIVLEDYLEIRPQNARRLRKLAQTGRLQIGPWYVLADSFLVSGEALIKNLEIGAEVARRFARPIKLGYLPDQFGHIAQMPQILAGFGLGAAVLWRGTPREVTRNRFVWEALDGTRIMALYLPFGYSNGADLPLNSAQGLLKRAGEIAARERAFAGDAPILVMNGTDHTAPDPRLMTRIEEAKTRNVFGLQVGTLEDYVKRLPEMPADGAICHKGELRSPARAHLLPGVTSARTWIKQRDFQNCCLLEHIAEPLAALVTAAGGDGLRLKPYLDLAWRLEIQNHPHDSICGCSVDQVHRDMVYRFDQAALIAEGAVRQAALNLFSRATGAPALAVMNGTFATKALVRGEAELEDPAAMLDAVAPGGRRFPAVTDVIRPQRALEIRMGAAEFKALVAGLSTPVLMGRAVNRYEVREAGAGEFEIDLLLSRAPLGDFDLTGLKQAAAQIPDGAALKIRGLSAARCAVSFVADGLTQAGITVYGVARAERPRPAGATQPDTSGPQEIANEYYRLRPSPRGLSIEDLNHARTLELYFEDDGDRGDEYNFDPLSGGSTITLPGSISTRVAEDGRVRKKLTLALAYELPAALAPGRTERSAATERLEIALDATLYAGLGRIDFDARVENRSRDHRLRAALRTPVSARESLSDTSFGIVRRPLEAAEPPGTEDIYPTAPQRSFTAVQGPELGAALIARGIYEAEVRGMSGDTERGGGSAILLTLLRCVGWLSRSDLRTRRGGAGPQLETPGAQELGSHRFEFAVTTWPGEQSYLDGGLIPRAQAYCFPPRAFAASAGFDAAAMGLAECDNPAVVFSTARLAEHRAGSWSIRAFSASPGNERARFRFGLSGRVRLVRLDGRPAGRRLLRSRNGEARLELRPFEIVTFEVSPGREARRQVKKNLGGAVQKD